MQASSKRSDRVPENVTYEAIKLKNAIFVIVPITLTRTSKSSITSPVSNTFGASTGSFSFDCERFGKSTFLERF